MRIERRGYPYIAGFFGAGLVFYLMRLHILSFIFFAGALFTLWFFRDPEREIPSLEGYLAPADGKVIKVERREDSTLGKGTLYISIFMSAFDVHVNRSPEDGVVRSVKRKKGKFSVAYKDGAEVENEQNEVIFERNDGKKMKVIQIAGAFARRIYFFKKEGDHVKRGERIGLIAFGSRVDVYLPPDVSPLVESGDRVRAGESIIAR